MKLGAITLTTPRLLAILGVMLILVVLLTPEESISGGGRSSFSTDPGGARILYELAQRMGWQTSRRTAALDSARVLSNVEVVIGAGEALGASETHGLLEHVRHGSGLVFSVDGGGAEIADSIGLFVGENSYLLPGTAGSECDPERRSRERPMSILPPTIGKFAWRRPAPGTVVPLMDAAVRREPFSPIIGFPMGAGRVVAVSSSELFTNEAMRICTWGADVGAARSFEYVRQIAGAAPTMQFDEFHHGYGAHPGSMTAVALYLSHTSSGHFLAQALIAALLLLFAAAPRAIVPQEPERIARRSPLEHADALGLAYFEVGASRTATSRLVDGLRRRAGRTIAAAGADDGALLTAIAQRTPALLDSVRIVRRGLAERLTGRELVAVGEAIAHIEYVLTTTPPTRA
jgi:hypothetical protein